ncbi:MAG: peptide chain release factor N(5)-glutamine methyltransferase [Flavobacteriaceae bacterium]
MTLIEERTLFRLSLAELYVQGEIDDLFKRAIAHYFSWSATKIGLEPHYTLSAKEANVLQRLLKELQTGRPLQYCLGSTTFMGMHFNVSPAVLIPRPETEELVEWILASEQANCLTVWDLCTGSGCIALGLKAHRPAWHLTGFDVSNQALEVAKDNAKKHQLSVGFYPKDVLHWDSSSEKCDLIVANPPYVLPSEKKNMHRNVLDFEPELALFVPQEDPLVFYREILKIGKKDLSESGVIYFEINSLLSDDLIKMGNKIGFAKASIKKDIFGKKRFVKFSQ